MNVLRVALEEVGYGKATASYAGIKRIVRQLENDQRKDEAAFELVIRIFRPASEETANRVAEVTWDNPDYSLARLFEVILLHIDGNFAQDIFVDVLSDRVHRGGDIEGIGWFRVFSDNSYYCHAEEPFTGVIGDKFSEENIVSYEESED